MKIEILDDAGAVVNLIVATPEFAEATYPGRWREFVPPVEPETASPLTVLQFRNRFTVAEKTAIYTAADKNVMVKVWLDDLAVAQFVDLGDPDTITGVHALEQGGLISVGRAAEILGDQNNA